MDLTRLSKQMAYILRHAPWEYELELDDEGWVPVEHLLDGLRSEREYSQILRSDIETLIRDSAKQRYELAGDRIRALYGYSVPGKLRKESAVPPSLLYHGTSSAAVAVIRVEGLRPMRRQYVHLSTDEATARIVGRRKGPQVTILTIDSLTAHAEGLAFFLGNDQTWLADHVPSQYIHFP